MVISPLEHPNTATGDPWAGQPKYANAIAGTAAALILLWALHHHLLKPWQRQHHRRLTALARWLSLASVILIPQPRREASSKAGRRPSTISLGMLLLLLGGFLIPFTITTFAVKPYYRTLSVYGSPPLALRAGFMALGTLPFLYATSAKVSYLHTLTGVPSDSWLVWHAWGARFCLFLALVHTFPFIYQPMREGGAAQMAEVFKSDDIYSTGVLALVALAVLVLPSGRMIRQRCYALWLAVHIPVALVFLVAMWVHCENLLTSWRFMYAATFFYLLNIALRLGKMLHHSDFFNHTTVQLSVYPVGPAALDGSLTRIIVPTMARWQPGQHVYLRLFPSPPATSQPHAPPPRFSRLAFARFWMQSALHSHPFTIVSLPPEDRHAALGYMVLLARATPRADGWTARLAEWVRLGGGAGAGAASEEVASVRWTALVDGPFGATSSPSVLDWVRLRQAQAARSSPVVRHVLELEARSPVARHDGVLFVSGGSGITFTLGLLLELVWARSKAEGLVGATLAQEKEGTAGGGALAGLVAGRWPAKVHFVWTVRSAAHLCWAEEQLRAVAQLAAAASGGDDAGWLSIVVHITGEGEGEGEGAQASEPPVPQLGRADSASGISSTAESETRSRHGGAQVEVENKGTGADGAHASKLPAPWTVRRGERLDAAVVLDEFLGSVSNLGSSSRTTPLPSVGMVLCGPPSLAEDATRAVKAVQMDIVRGRGRGLTSLDELRLYQEDFGS